MCGINGIFKFGYLKEDEKKLFKELLKNTEIRGKDATGIYNGYEVVKIDKPARNFVRTKAFKNAFKKRTNFLFGHNRLTTVGNEKFIENNHPFETEQFVFAHNGTFHNYHLYYTKLDLIDINNKYVETDSFVFLKLMEKHYKENNDIIEALKYAAKNINGTMACWLYDKYNNDLYLFRRSYYTTSPLNIVYFNDMIIFASELSHIIHAIYKVYNTTKNIISIELKDNELIKINLDNGEIEKSTMPEYEYKYNNTYNCYDYDDYYGYGTNSKNYNDYMRETLLNDLSYVGIELLKEHKSNFVFWVNPELTEFLKSNHWFIYKNKSGESILRIKKNKLRRLANEIFMIEEE